MGKKVLIVEDEPVLGLEISEDLRKVGYEVLPVIVDGDRVITVAMDNKPDVIIMDIKIFGFRDGIEAANRLRPLMNTPIVYLTSRPYSEVKNRVESTAPAWYLEKPYDVTRLMSTLDLVWKRG